jgi:hypothetical protein
VAERAHDRQPLAIEHEALARLDQNVGVIALLRDPRRSGANEDGTAVRVDQAKKLWIVELHPLARPTVAARIVPCMA